MPAFTEDRWQELALAHGQVVAVLFWAGWCIPSRSALQTFESVAGRIAGIRGGTIDAEANRGLVGRYAVRGLPTLLLLRQGREEARRVGLMTADDLLRFLRQPLPATASR